MISMMTMPISIEITVPSGPATGRKVVPGMANTPQPTMQPKAIAQTSITDKYRSSGLEIVVFSVFMSFLCYPSGAKA